MRNYNDFHKNSYEEMTRDKSVEPRPIVRNTSELAEEFGISTISLANLINKNNGPNILLITRSKKGGNKIKWYGLKEMRDWYKNYLANKNK